MEMDSMTLLPLRTTLCNLVLRDSRNGGDIFVGKFRVGEHCVDHSERSLRIAVDFSFGSSLCTALLSALIHVKFVSHKLAPYECVSFVMRHLVVDGFGFTRVCIFTSPVFEVINGESAPKNVHRAQENDVLLLEIGVKVPFRECDSVTNALVISSSLWEFLCIDHLHLTPSASACAAQSCQPASGLPRHSPCMLFQIKRAFALMFCIVTQNSFWNRRFQMVNFDAQQVFDEGLRNMLVAEYEPEHNGVGNVKIVKRFDVHNYTSVRFRGFNLQRKILKKQNIAIFANNRLQNRSFCKLLNYRRGSLKPSVTSLRTYKLLWRDA